MAFEIADIAPEALKAIDILVRRGFEGYVVGGCVRDLLMGRTPSDWDIATDASPQEVAHCFSELRVIETGLKHGTLTVLIDGMALEITTFRVDGEYRDGRRPESVAFTRDLRSDLARRDFTINAMAYSPATGLVDSFGGRADIANRLVRCVGEAERRFGEDALRIMRAARFASALGFGIERDTFSAMNSNSHLLNKISRERILVELTKLVCGVDACHVLLDCREIIAQVIPEVRDCFGFDQHSPYHRYDVWEHTARTVQSAPPQHVLRFAALYHDLGKPQCFSIDADGIGHSYSHAAASAEIARCSLRALRSDNLLLEDVVFLVKHHCDELPEDRKRLLRKLSRIGEQRLRWLMALKRADILGQAGDSGDPRLAALEHTASELEHILEEKACFSLRELAISGGDLLNAGVSEGKRIGELLDALLGMVMAGELLNDRAALLDHAHKIIRGE